MKMVEWVEPWNSQHCVDAVLNMRMTEFHVIVAQRSDAERNHGYVYLYDEDALYDFMAVHWAHFVDEKET